MENGPILANFPFTPTRFSFSEGLIIISKIAFFSHTTERKIQNDDLRKKTKIFNSYIFRREKMGVIYGITWYTMSLAMPCIFSLNSVIKNTLERKPSDRQRADTLFWLKYWVVFAYYYVLESVFDTIIAWLPLYNEVGFG